MKAIIFAAGLGTRLGHLTHNKPKALVPVAGKPLLEWLLIKLKYYSICDIVINVHHYAEQIVDFIDDLKIEGLNIKISDETDFLLDTGGGLKKAAKLLDGNEPILVHNVDILSNLDFFDLKSEFLRTNPDALLVVKDRKSSRKLFFDNSGLLSGWINETSGEFISVEGKSDYKEKLGYCGICVVNPKLPCDIDRDGAFGLIPAFLDLAVKKTIKSYKVFCDYIDVGKPETLKLADDFVNKYYKEFCL